MHLAREIGNCAGCLALAVDLPQARSQRIKSAQRIGDVHRAPAIHNGVESRNLERTDFRRLDKALDHGGCCEEARAAKMIDQRNHFHRIESPAFRHDSRGAARQIGDQKQPGRVRLGCDHECVGPCVDRA